MIRVIKNIGLKVLAIGLMASFLSVSFITIFHKHEIKQEQTFAKETVHEAEFCKICEFTAHHDVQQALLNDPTEFVCLSIELPKVSYNHFQLSFYSSFLQGFTNKGPPVLS